jgi:rubrerythrin
MQTANADRWLPDGTPYFGRLGEVAYDPDEDLVQCHLCGEWFKWVGGLHLKYRHADWTIGDYRRTFRLNGSQVTMASGSRAVLRANTVERLKNGQLGSALSEGKVLQGGKWQSLSDRRPDLVSELHPNRNPTIDPVRLGVWSSERVWWRCRQCGHEWKATVMGRAAYNGGCPVCGPRATAAAHHRGRRPPMNQRSLAVLRPGLTAELHPDRNHNLDPQRVGVWSRRKVWWLCRSCGHEWEAMVMNRQQGTGCPRCASAQRIATYHKNASAT